MKALIQKIKDWFEGKSPCEKHGASSLYQHGYLDEWECWKCKEELMKKYEDN